MNHAKVVDQDLANEVGKEWEKIAVSGTSAGRAKKLHRAHEGTALCQYHLNNCNGAGKTKLLVKDGACYPPGYRDFCRVCAYLEKVEGK